METAAVVEDGLVEGQDPVLAQGHPGLADPDHAFLVEGAAFFHGGGHPDEFCATFLGLLEGVVGEDEELFRMHAFAHRRPEEREVDLFPLPEEGSAFQLPESFFRHGKELLPRKLPAGQIEDHG